MADPDLSSSTTVLTIVFSRVGEQGIHLKRIADQMSSSAHLIRQVSPDIFGRLIGSAAHLTEPATSSAHRRFVDTLSQAIAELGGRIADSVRAYSTYESQCQELVGSHSWR